MSELTLRITEIFYSLQGEARTAGLPTAFIRLTGCPLRCHYCDSEYAFHGGTIVSIADIVAKAESFKPRYICVTGGEPMAQPNCLPLMTALCDKGWQVSIETSGALPVDKIDPRVSRVVDLKTPGSGEVSRNDYNNIPALTRHDQVKFVICDRTDYEWARFKIAEYELADKVGDVLFSPSFSQIDATQLAEWVIADNLPVRFQLQQHKFLWGDKPGH